MGFRWLRRRIMNPTAINTNATNNNNNNNAATAGSSNSSSSAALPRRRLWSEACLDGCQWAMEGVIYLLGPLLICLALGIMGLLTYVFGTILVPMLREYHGDRAWMALAAHTGVVILLLANILVNYGMCVTTRPHHSRPEFQAVVRELARVTPDFSYPSEIPRYRKEFEDKMLIRIQRRHLQRMGNNNNANNAAAAQTAQQQLTQRRNNNNNNNNNNNANSSDGNSNPPPAPRLRNWMLMGPYEWGFCTHSMQPKPPRSHYDHVTKSLVLNLDHYCPWMFNAIGYFNYRYFFNFLVFVFIGMIYGTSLIWAPFWALQSPAYREQSRQERSHHGPVPRKHAWMPHRDEKMLISLAFMLCVAIGLAIAILGGFHAYLLLTGQTTIEFHANWAHHRRARREGRTWRNPYDQGWRQNWKQVYGDSFWLAAMLLPSRRPPDYLPVPVPGQCTKRKPAAHDAMDNDDVEQGEMAAFIGQEA